MKDELRLSMKEKRRALTRDEVSEKSAAIHRLLFSTDCVKNADTVCTFISAFKEPDTTKIIHRLFAEHKKVIVPITDAKTNTLSLSYIENTRDLQAGAFGILEPSVIKPADTGKIDVILVPGLAFDKNGGRLGFGKGYYDRLLNGCSAVKIGLCYDFQLFDEIPTDEHDVMMDIIVTERNITYVI